MTAGLKTGFGGDGTGSAAENMFLRRHNERRRTLWRRLFGSVVRFGGRSFARLDANGAHHAAVFMFQKVAVIDERADAIRVAEIDSDSDERVERRFAVPERHVD